MGCHKEKVGRHLLSTFNTNFAKLHIPEISCVALTFFFPQAFISWFLLFISLQFYDCNARICSIWLVETPKKDLEPWLHTLVLSYFSQLDLNLYVSLSSTKTLYALWFFSLLSLYRASQWPRIQPEVDSERWCSGPPRDGRWETAMVSLSVRRFCFLFILKVQLFISKQLKGDSGDLLYSKYLLYIY